MNIDENADLYEKIAKESGITLYRRFTEQEASAMLDISIQTLRRIRDKGGIAHLRVSDRHVRFFGFQLCEYLVSKIKDKSCPDTISKDTKSGISGSPADNLAALRGAGHGLTKPLAKPNALHLAQQTFQKQKQS